LYRLSPKELKTVHDWIQNFERFWSDVLARIKQAAEKKAKRLAANKISKSKNQPPLKEKRHGH